MPYHWLGVDLAERQDYTAFCLITVDNNYKEAQRRNLELYEKYEGYIYRADVDDIDIREAERWLEEHEEDVPEPTYEGILLKRYQDEDMADIAMRVRRIQDYLGPENVFTAID